MHSPTEGHPENAILENKEIELTWKLKSSAWFPSEVIRSDFFMCVFQNANFLALPAAPKSTVVTWPFGNHSNVTLMESPAMETKIGPRNYHECSKTARNVSNKFTYTN